MYPNFYQTNRPENNLIRVTGLSGAKAYQMPPNSTVALFDGGEDLMYIKSTDGAGFPTIKIFKFEPIETPAQNLEDYVNKSELQQIREELENVKQSIQRIGEPKSASKK